ncbi:MAG: hypothetical protein WC900_08125 [Oscillospiraceae bacterium]|jgi:hypothetical protein
MAGESYAAAQNNIPDYLQITKEVNMFINKRRFLRKLIVILFTALPIIFTCSATAEMDDFEKIEPNKVPDVLSMLASATQANYDKIHTWQGEIISKSIVTIQGRKARELLSRNTNADPNNLPDKIQVIHNNAIEYNIDVPNEHFVSLSDRTEPPAYFDPENNKLYPLDWGPGESIQIVTPEHQTEISPGRWSSKDKTIKSRRATKESPHKPVSRIDPREVFYIGNKTLWLSLSQLTQSLKIPGIPHFGVVIKKKASNDNTIYRMEISEPGRDYPFQVLVLDSEVDFNCTYIENWQNKDYLMSKTTTEYVSHNGAFLPKKRQMSQYFSNGDLMRQKIYTIEHQQINKPISNSKFSIQNYLQEGDELRDRITHKKFEYKNNQLVEVSQEK